VRRWQKSLAVGAIAALLVGVPLFGLRAGDTAATYVVYLEAAPDSDRSRLVIEPVQPEDDDPSDERVVYTVAHERGFMPRGVLSPDGRAVALVRQPRGRPEREAAEALVVDFDRLGEQTVVMDRAFGLSTPVFSTTGPPRIFVTSATIAPGPPPSDDEMRAGRLRPYDFTVWEVDRTSLVANERYEERLTWLQTLGVGLVKLAPQSPPTPALLMYRITHGGADLSALSLVAHEDPVNVANLGFSIARDFDVSTDGDALLFLSREPADDDAFVEVVHLTTGEPPQQLGGAVGKEASPIWARSFREWFLVRRPAKVGRDQPPLRVHRASLVAPAGRALDSLTSLTGVAEGPEVILPGSTSADGRWVCVRTDPGVGPLFFLRDTFHPQSARPLGDGGLVRVLGYQ
jgi:hypothetical protein